jgi:2-polyprenyl-3-methyl-5-hydroxy-6-metoxy-1,4-benzoquinol methylase
VGAMSCFDAKAATWDTPERVMRAAAVADAIRAEVPLDRGLRMIDVGAGTGLLGLALAPDVGEVVLAEPSAGMREVLHAKVAALGDPRISVMDLDLAADQPREGTFDLAVSLLVLHHVEDTIAALRSIAALLAPGGRIALADLEAEDGSFHDDPTGIHHHGFERTALAAAAAVAGFLDARVVTATEIEKDGRSYPVVLLLGTRG